MSEWHKRLKSFSDKLPDTAQDKFYESTAARIDTIVGGDQVRLKRLIMAREEFSRMHQVQGYIQWEKFYAWLVEEYGIKMTMSEGGMVNLDYEVVDENKHLIFVLKHSGDHNG